MTHALIKFILLGNDVILHIFIHMKYTLWIIKLFTGWKMINAMVMKYIRVKEIVNAGLEVSVAILNREVMIVTSRWSLLSQDFRKMWDWTISFFGNKEFRIEERASNKVLMWDPGQRVHLRNHRDLAGMEWEEWIIEYASRLVMEMNRLCKTWLTLTKFGFYCVWNGGHWRVQSREVT